MVKPFISYAPQRQKRAEWLAEILKALGFEDAILTSGADPKSSRKKSRDDLERADCFLALVSPLRGPDGTINDPSRAAPWIEQDTAVAVHREIPVALIWEKNMARTPVLEEVAFASEEADFDDPEAFLALAPRIIAIAGKIQSFYEKTSGEDYPFVSEKVHIIQHFPSETEWRNLRMISLTALKRAECINHSVDACQDKTPGISVKLADPEHDLKVMCLSDPSRIDVQLLRNEDAEVAYKILFTPPLKPGETVLYRHESLHKNIFPMTLEAVRKRAKMTGSPAYMKDGYVGNALDVRRPIETLVLEIEAPLRLGLAFPQVKVHASLIEIEEESAKIGNPESKPRLWDVSSDEARELWKCRVKIPKPRIGYSYFLLVKPTK